MRTVTNARLAGKDLLGTKSTGEIAFGQNCTNIMFHLARSIENCVNDKKYAADKEKAEAVSHILAEMGKKQTPVKTPSSDHHIRNSPSPKKALTYLTAV